MVEDVAELRDASHTSSQTKELNEAPSFKWFVKLRRSARNHVDIAGCTTSLVLFFFFAFLSFSKTRPNFS